MVKNVNKLYNEKSFPLKNRTIFRATSRTRKVDLKKGKLVVYTAISGGYDELQTPEYINSNFDYICFTDNEDLKSDFWEIRLMEDLDLDHVRKARTYKILPHIYLPEYDYSLWIDANTEISGNLEDFLDRCLKTSPLMCINHPNRRCVYEEAEVCIDSGKDYEIIISNQVDKYRMDGFPKNQGLIASGILFREHNDHRVIKLMDDWYREVIEYSKRDQLSFNYVCWKNRFGYDSLDFNDVHRKYFRLKRHKKRDSLNNEELEGCGLNRMWNDLLYPIIEGVNANYVVEIGSDTGSNTLNILEYCAENDAYMTTIDPFPKFDTKEFKARYGDRFEIFEELSLNSLPLLQDYDVILIDGDHNWYTVYNELKIIEKNFKGKKFPLIFLHDIGWPYGRRDLYYNPENIPEFYRQPYVKLGIYPGQLELKKEGGMNHTLCNSIYENNLKNGVLTAVEDFIDESDLQFSLKIINAFHGLGILYTNDSGIDYVVEDALKKSGLVEALEEERIKHKIKASELTSINRSLEEKKDRSERKLKNTQNQLNRTKIQLNNIRKELNQKDAQVIELTADLYNNPHGRSKVQRIISKFPTLYMLFKIKDNGISNTIINIKGYKQIKKDKLLDEGYYLSNNYDLRLTGMDPILHYINYGFKENRKPNPSFDGDYYLKTYGEVKKSKLNPLVHYALYGKNEGKKTHPQPKKAIKRGPKVGVTDKGKIKGNIGANNNSRITISGWLAKIGDDNPRKAVIKLDEHIFEVNCNNFSQYLKKNKINGGRHAFELFVPYNLFDGEKHQLSLIDKSTGNLVTEKEVTFNQRRDYQDFSGFLVN